MRHTDLRDDFVNHGQYIDTEEKMLVQYLSPYGPGLECGERFGRHV